MSLTSWLVVGILPGIERHPLKKLNVDEEALLQLLHRWRDEAINAGRKITRIVLAFEADRDGFWLARWLRARNIEAYVIHPTSIAVSREHRRAKTDRLDTELLKRAFLGWLRGKSDHCSMAAIPTLEEEERGAPTANGKTCWASARASSNRMRACLVRFGVRNFKPTLRKAPTRLEAFRTPEGGSLQPNSFAELRRDMARLRFVTDQISEIEETRLQRLEHAPNEGSQPMVRLLARVIGVGIETADMLVHGSVTQLQIKERSLATPVSPALRTKAAEGDGRKDSLGLAMPTFRRGMIQLAWRIPHVPKGERSGPMVSIGDQRGPRSDTMPGIDIRSSTAVQEGPRFAATCASTVAIAASRALIWLR